MTVFFSQLINGLSLGSIYALIALGYSMVYGIILLLNFAHGDVIMVGAYMSWFVMNQLGLGPVTAVCATVITCTLLGVVIEKVAYTPLRSAPRISLLITAIGVSFFLEYTAELLMGSGAKVIPSYFEARTFYFGKVPVGLTSVITLVVTVLSMLVLTFLVQKTKLGKAMRAVSEDMDAARLMGINVNSTISFTFAVGSALAGIGAVLYCCSYPQATPTMGSMLGLKAFVAAVLGGIGSIPGAMIGGIAIGLCECFVSAIGLSAWKDAVTFAILIIVLLFKPTGFLGRKVQEKVSGGHEDEYQTQNAQNARALPDEYGAGGAAVPGAFLPDRESAFHLSEQGADDRGHQHHPGCVFERGHRLSGPAAAGPCRFHGRGCLHLRAVHQVQPPAQRHLLCHWSGAGLHHGGPVRCADRHPRSAPDR